MPYHFGGCGSFVDAAAASHGLNDARHVALARGLDPVKRVQTAIGRASDARSEHREEIFAEALKWRAILAVSLAGIDASIAEARAGLGLTTPVKDEPKSPPMSVPKRDDKGKK